MGLRGGGDQIKKTQIELNVDPNRCDRQPGGHLIKSGETNVCIYLYDADEKPIKDVEVEDLTSDGAIVRDKKTGERETVEI